MAPEVGLEPTTFRLTAGRSTIELLWNSKFPASKPAATGTGNLLAALRSVKLILTISQSLSDNFSCLARAALDSTRAVLRRLRREFPS